MGELILAAPVAGLASRNRIIADDVVLLRQEVFRDGVVTRGEAESLFALDASCADKCAEWPVFFIEAVTDYIVHQEAPSGYISDDNADWLIRSISRDGMVDTVTELEMLIHVLEKAKTAPERLSAYALDQVAHAVLDGRGPLARGRALVPGLIERAEVDLLRRILYAFAGEANVAVTRAEADVLFRINDRTVEEMNDPSWNELFVKAIASFVLGGGAYAPTSRQEALRHEALFEAADVDLMGFFGRMFSAGATGVADALRTDGGLEDAWRERNGLREAQTAAGLRIDDSEANWLVDRIGRDRLLHDNERALLAFIAAESSDIHPALQPLLAKVA
jgi:hypothetical protein